MGELSGLIRAERLCLIEFLETLSPDQWAVPSLCSGWTVRDVAAHLAWSPALRPLELTVGLILGGFRLNRINADNARQWSSRGLDSILEQLRLNATKGLRPPGTPERAALTDALCHAVDIGRPLGRSVPLNVEAFSIVADYCVGLRWPLSITVGGNVRNTVQGVRLVADDIDWSRGAGPEVRGRAASLLLLLTGRPVGADELTGQGAAQLYARL